MICPVIWFGGRSVLTEVPADRAMPQAICLCHSNMVKHRSTTPYRSTVERGFVRELFLAARGTVRVFKAISTSEQSYSA